VLREPWALEVVGSNPTVLTRLIVSRQQRETINQSRAASDSASVTMSSSNFNPSSQNAGSFTSTPSLPTSTCGASEPPDDTISRYRGTTACPSCLYFWYSASTSSSPKA